MAIRSRLIKYELNILTLNKVLILGLASGDRRKVDENILTCLLTIADSDEAIACLVIKPLNLSEKALTITR
jgi:hypothetical protein